MFFILQRRPPSPFLNQTTRKRTLTVSLRMPRYALFLPEYPAADEAFPDASLPIEAGEFFVCNDYFFCMTRSFTIKTFFTQSFRKNLQVYILFRIW